MLLEDRVNFDYENKMTAGNSMTINSSRKSNGKRTLKVFNQSASSPAINQHCTGSHYSVDDDETSHTDAVSSAGLSVYSEPQLWFSSSRSAASDPQSNHHNRTGGGGGCSGLSLFGRSLRKYSPGQNRGCDNNSGSGSGVVLMAPGEESLRRMEVQGELLLNTIKSQLSKQTLAEQECNTGITVHLDRAVARYASRNPTGAILSMRKVKHFQQDHARLQNALAFLHRRQAQLLSRLNEARAMTALRCGDGDGGEFSAFSVQGKINYDLSSFGNVDEKLAEILGVSSEMSSFHSGEWTDELLLQELTALDDSPMGERLEI